MTGSPWRVERDRAAASVFHARPIPDPATPSIWVHDVTAPAVVLGSTQAESDADADACARAGVELVRRRSGGGAVWLAPGQVMWIDVILPAGHDGWADDVHAPMTWLGDRLAAVFAELGVADVEVHRGSMLTTAHSRRICFDGLGPGELTLGPAKLVGMSQRRTRSAARLQCCWYSRHDHADLLRFLDRHAALGGPPGAGRTAGREAGLDRALDASSLRPVATTTVSADDVVPLLVERLTSSSG